MRNRLFPASFSLLLSCLFACAAALPITSLSGCAAGDGNSSNDNNNGGTDNGGGGSTGDSSTLNLTTNSQGVATTTFTIPAGSTKFSVTAEVADQNGVRFDALSDDAGNDYLSPGGQMISFANEFFTGVNSISAPSRNVDPAVSSSVTYTAVVRTSGGGGNSSVDLTINTRADTSFSGGTLLVNVFYVGEVGQSSSSKSAVASGLDEFKRIYSEEANISIRISEHDVSGPASVPSPFDGAALYRTSAQLGDFPAVNLFIVGDVQGNEGQILGISGGIPGPPIPSIRSGVAISILTGAGPDGDYSDEELRLLGESMAHETGHFMGLFHPVDFTGSSVDASDPLTDTPTCTRTSDCEANTTLIRNLMYATPITSGNGFVPQDQITQQQSDVLNRYIAVD